MDALKKVPTGTWIATNGNQQDSLTIGMEGRDSYSIKYQNGDGYVANADSALAAYSNFTWETSGWTVRKA